MVSWLDIGTKNSRLERDSWASLIDDSCSSWNDSLASSDMETNETECELNSLKKCYLNKWLLTICGEKIKNCVSKRKFFLYFKETLYFKIQWFPPNNHLLSPIQREKKPYKCFFRPAQSYKIFNMRGGEENDFLRKFSLL